jgi:transposase
MIGLPSLRALDGSQAARIWLSAEATDMRCGFDRLAVRVRVVIGQDPLGGSRILKTASLKSQAQLLEGKATCSGSCTRVPSGNAKKQRSRRE